jgi:hypothetical protein
MCQKRQRRCPELLAIPEEAFEEWNRCATYEQVRSCWSRLGGRTTMHRYGREFYAHIAQRARERRTA